MNLRDLTNDTLYEMFNKSPSLSKLHTWIYICIYIYIFNNYDKLYVYNIWLLKLWNFTYIAYKHAQNSL